MIAERNFKLQRVIPNPHSRHRQRHRAHDRAHDADAERQVLPSLCGPPRLSRRRLLLRRHDGGHDRLGRYPVLSRELQPKSTFAVIFLRQWITVHLNLR